LDYPEKNLIKVFKDSLIFAGRGEINTVLQLGRLQPHWQIQTEAEAYPSKANKLGKDKTL